MADKDFLDEMVELIEGSDLDSGDKAFLNTMAKHHEDGMAKIHKHKEKLTHKHVKTFAAALAHHYSIQHAWISGAIGHSCPPTPPPAGGTPPAPGGDSGGGGAPPPPPAP